MISRKLIKCFGQEEPNYIPSVPPSYFKTGELVKVDLDEKVVRIAVRNSWQHWW